MAALSSSRFDVLAALASGPKTRLAIEEVTQRDERTVRRALAALGSFVEKAESGSCFVYSISQGGREALAAHGRPPPLPTPLAHPSTRAASTTHAVEYKEESSSRGSLESLLPPMGGPPPLPTPLEVAVQQLVEMVAQQRDELAAKDAEIEELGAELDALRGDVSREKPIVHRDLKPENVLKTTPRIAPNEREKLYLEFRRKKELAKNGKPLGEPLVQLILSEITADPGILDRWEQSERDAKQLQQGAEEKKAKKREEEARLRPTTSDSERRDRIRELDAGLLRLGPEARADIGERSEMLAREAGVTPNSFKWTNKVRDIAREIFEKECGLRLESMGVKA